jgi:hypothetical protein
MTHRYRVEIRGHDTEWFRQLAHKIADILE